MEKTNKLIAVFLSAVVATLVFYRQAPGLNLLVFELFTFIYLFATKQFAFKGKNQTTLGLALLATAFATVFTCSAFAITVNVIVFFAFTGVIIYPEVKSLTTALGLAIANIAGAQDNFLKSLSRSKLSGKKLNLRIKRLGIFLIPLVIIVVFIAIYRTSNPVFDDVMRKIGDFIDEYILSVFDHLDVLMVLTFLFFLLASNTIYLRSALASLVNKDKAATDELIRTRLRVFNQYGKVLVKKTGLKNEYAAAVFLLVTLNALILLLNIIDINWVWFNFTWEGQYLKQFVHEGTYLLILSILISIGLVLYYFRANLNFYPKNKLLKYLSYAWLAQNAVLAISVGIRNYWYIQYFSLAYKRIGVIIFLLLTLYGLYTVFIKVKDRRSSFYLFRTNTYATLVVLVITSLFNWDVIIAKYNFAHSDKSFLHLDFMASLSDKALPYLDKPLAEIEKIKLEQSDNYEFELKGRKEKMYMSPADYCDKINRRKYEFIVEWEEKSIWEWNWPEYQAYRQLKAGMATNN